MPLPCLEHSGVNIYWCLLFCRETCSGPACYTPWEIKGSLHCEPVKQFLFLEKGGSSSVFSCCHHKQLWTSVLNNFLIIAKIFPSTWITQVTAWVPPSPIRFKHFLKEVIISRKARAGLIQPIIHGDQVVPSRDIHSLSSLVRRLSSERGHWKFPKSAASYCILQWEYINSYTESCISAVYSKYFNLCVQEDKRHWQLFWGQVGDMILSWEVRLLQIQL